MRSITEIILRWFPPLESRDYRYLLLGQFISMTGSQMMQEVAVTWQLYEFTHSPSALGLLGAFRVAPVVVFALLGGVIADTFDRRHVMLVSQLVLASTSLVLALATRQGWASAGLLYAMASVAGAARTVDTPTRQALIPLLVPRERLSRALSLWSLAVKIATVLGPLLGGLVLARGGVAPVYFIDAASFAAVMGALLTMRTRTPARPGARVGLAAVLEGLAFLKRTPIIRSTMLLDFFATFFGGSMLLMPIFADQILGVGKLGMGPLAAAQAVGAAIAGLAMTYFALPRRQGLVILASITFYGLAIAVFGFSRWFWLSLLALAASGAADTVSTVIRQTVRQLETPDELRGRMTSVNMMFFMGGPQLGEVEAGYVARLTTPRFSVTSGGIACVVVAVIAALVAPSLRKYEPPPAA